MWSITFFRWEIECEEVTKRLFLLLVDEVCLVLFDVSFVFKAYLGVVWFCSQLSHTTSNVRMQREPCKFAEKMKKITMGTTFPLEISTVRFDIYLSWKPIACDGCRYIEKHCSLCIQPIGCVFRRSSLKQGVRCHSMYLSELEKKRILNARETSARSTRTGPLAHAQSTIVLVWILSLSPLTSLISFTDSPILHAPCSETNELTWVTKREFLLSISI